MSPLIWVILAFLGMISFIDIRFRAVPSIFLTGMLFATLILSPNGLYLGVAGALLGLLLLEGGFIGGMADLKVIALISLMIPNLLWFFGFIVLLGVYGITWKVLVKWKLKKETEYAFLPVLFFVYLSLLILGGIA